MVSSLFRDISRRIFTLNCGNTARVEKGVNLKVLFLKIGACQLTKFVKMLSICSLKNKRTEVDGSMFWLEGIN